MINIADHESVHRWQTFNAYCDICVTPWEQNGTHYQNKSSMPYNVSKLRESGWFIQHLDVETPFTVCYDCTLAALEREKGKT